MTAPMMYRWSGTVMQPMRYFAELAHAQFKPDEVYWLVEHGDRRMTSHRHYFACINEAHANLKEDEHQRWPTPEHLRKWALTFTPFCDVRHFRAMTRKEAERVLEFLDNQPYFCRVEIRGQEVVQFVPLSQSFAAMPDQRTFAQSKRAVLDVLARHLGTSVDELEEAGRRAA